MILKPHKATDAAIDKIKFPVIASCKIDGVRGCFLNETFSARTLKPFRNSHLMQTFSNPKLRGFDGELALGEPNDAALCRSTTSYVNSYAHNTMDTLPDWYIFDFITPAIVDMPYAARLAIAEEYIAELKDKSPGEFCFLQTLPVKKLCHTLEDIIDFHATVTAAGFEGTVLRHVKAPHKSGRSTIREGYFLRLKDAGTEEAVIIGVLEAQENLNPAVINELGETERSSHQDNKIGKGMIGALVVRIPDGRTLTIGAGKMTHAERIIYWEQQQDIIGRICTYRYMKHGEHEMRRHPRFVEFRDEDI